MWIQQALGLIVIEFCLKTWKLNLNDRIKNKYVEMMSVFMQGSLSGFISNLVTTAAKVNRNLDMRKYLSL